MLNLERVNNVPLYSTSTLDADFQRWLITLVDSLNTMIQQTNDALDNLTAPSFTQAEITAMAATLPNGILLYDTTNDVYVGRENGAFRQFDTSIWP